MIVDRLDGSRGVLDGRLLGLRVAHAEGHETDLGELMRYLAEATASRPYGAGNRTVDTPWGGRFSHYRRLGGIRLPTRAEVRWELPEGPFPDFRGEITAYEVRG